MEGPGEAATEPRLQEMEGCCDQPAKPGTSFLLFPPRRMVGGGAAESLGCRVEQLSLLKAPQHTERPRVSQDVTASLAVSAQWYLLSRCLPPPLICSGDITVDKMNPPCPHGASHLGREWIP